MHYIRFKYSSNLIINSSRLCSNPSTQECNNYFDPPNFNQSSNINKNLDFNIYKYLLDDIGWYPTC